MKLSPLQLEVALTAVAEFLTPIYDDLTEWQQNELRKQLVPWLTPIFLQLPEQACAEEIRNHIFKYEFLEAAQNFEVDKLRQNEIYDLYGAEDLKKRLDVAAVENSADYLTHLAAVALEAVEALPAEVHLATVMQAPQTLEKLQDTLDDPDAFAIEIAKVLD